MMGKATYDHCTFCRNCQEVRPIISIRCNICGRKVAHRSKIHARNPTTTARINSHRIELTVFEILEAI